MHVLPLLFTIVLLQFVPASPVPAAKPDPAGQSAGAVSSKPPGRGQAVTALSNPWWG